MSYIQKLAAEHNLKPGDDVIVVTGEHDDGGTFRRLYRYDTMVSWTEHELRRAEIRYKTTREPWDGIESVDFDNGD